MPSSQRGLLTERIARQLEHEIWSGELAAGVKLPSERELAEQFAASRNVVREALRRLEAQHLIEVAPGRGSFVSERASAAPCRTAAGTRSWPPPGSRRTRVPPWCTTPASGPG